MNKKLSVIIVIVITVAIIISTLVVINQIQHNSLKAIQSQKEEYDCSRLRLSTKNTKQLLVSDKQNSTSLPTACYNPSTLKVDNIVLYCYRVSSFTRCPSSVSEYYYKTSPSSLGSEIMLQWKDKKGIVREVMLDIPRPDSGTILFGLDNTKKTTQRLEYVPGYEDGRLVLFKNNILLLANARNDDAVGKSSMYLIHVCHKKDLNNLKNKYRCRVSKLIANLDAEIPRESSDEKNWSPFVYVESTITQKREEKLYLVYSISPTIVLEVPELNLDDYSKSLSGKNLSNNTDVIVCNTLSGNVLSTNNIPTNISSNSMSDRTKNIPNINPDTQISLPNNNSRTLRQLRGGSQLIPAEYSTYIGIGHFRSDKEYYSVPYMLSALPPFGLIQVGTPIKIQGDTIEYVSGIRRDDDGLVITYGVNDCTSHEANIRMDYHSDEYFHLFMVGDV